MGIEATMICGAACIYKMENGAEEARLPSNGIWQYRIEGV